jgi:hypothetical protein
MHVLTPSQAPVEGSKAVAVALKVLAPSPAPESFDRPVPSTIELQPFELCAADPCVPEGG